ncbi:protein FAR-RED IMPAIRED RESPONSE 1-like [Salvia divinorum]|uniref:Protein FAR-RED IMPAIRED RESPONSE 1-like n=1 Tax=Salvia divinorum TaxID=28513 RepID=A0ABD1FRW5_SALDI
MTFVDEEEAYKAYAFTKGFGIRKVFDTTYRTNKYNMRWTKSARQEVRNDDSGSCSLDLTMSRTYHLKKLMRLSVDVMSLSVHDIETVKIAKKRLQELDDEIRNYAFSFCKSDNHTMITEDNDVPQHCPTRILDPLKRKSKGVTNSRPKSAIEKRKKGKSLKGKKPFQQYHGMNPINQPPIWNTISHMNPSHQSMGTPSYMTSIQPGAEPISFTSLLTQHYQSVTNVPQIMFLSDCLP